MSLDNLVRVRGPQTAFALLLLFGFFNMDGFEISLCMLSSHTDILNATEVRDTEELVHAFKSQL